MLDADFDDFEFSTERSAPRQWVAVAPAIAPRRPARHAAILRCCPWRRASNCSQSRSGSSPVTVLRVVLAQPISGGRGVGGSRAQLCHGCRAVSCQSSCWYIDHAVYMPQDQWSPQTARARAQRCREGGSRGRRQRRYCGRARQNRNRLSVFRRCADMRGCCGGRCCSCGRVAGPGRAAVPPGLRLSRETRALQRTAGGNVPRHARCAWSACYCCLPQSLRAQVSCAAEIGG